MSERIQKVLARTGLASRRTIENWIREGRIEVNGQLAVLGQIIHQTDEVKLDGEWLADCFFSPKRRLLLYYKPEGEICSHDDPEGRPTVYDDLPKLRVGKWISVGRLDINTLGLLLLTNDGELAHQLMHPSFGIEREYAVRVRGEVSEAMALAMTQGVQLEEGLVRFEHILSQGGEGANRWYHVVLMEGRQRVVRRLFETQGLVVSRLIRVRFGPLILPSLLDVGQTIELSESDITDLLSFLRLREEVYGGDQAV